MDNTFLVCHICCYFNRLKALEISLKNVKNSVNIVYSALDRNHVITNAFRNFRMFNFYYNLGIWIYLITSSKNNLSFCFKQGPTKSFYKQHRRGVCSLNSWFWSSWLAADQKQHRSGVGSLNSWFWSSWLVADQKQQRRDVGSLNSWFWSSWLAVDQKQHRWDSGSLNSWFWSSWLARRAL